MSSRHTDIRNRIAGRGGNLGATVLKRHRRRGDPMAAYDALPAPLRHWLAEAAMPWSPISCHRIWQRACKTGTSVEEVLDTLSRAEKRAMEREYRPS